MRHCKPPVLITIEGRTLAATFHYLADMDLIMIAVVLGLLMLQHVPTMSESLTRDGLALLDFKDGLTVTSPLLANWKASDTSPCSWSGITCSKSGDVQNVSLPAQIPMLEGNISSSLGKLKYLQELVLTNNSLTGSIPGEFGKLSRLKVLDLTSNRLSGAIPPQLGNCSSLVTLWLAGNTLSGAFPESLRHLRNLSSVFIGDNIPNQKDIPIQAFENQNSISGSVPMGIFENPNLVSFDVSNNNLGGDITSALEEMSKHQNIESISMEQNHFVGMLPPSIGNATTLLRLNLLHQSDRYGKSGGGFGGRIPKEVGKLVNVLRFYIAANNFFGEIPNEIGNMTSLIALDVSANNMNGTIPSSLGNLVNLKGLYLSHNHFSGPIPMSFESLTKLVIFNLDDNDFIGPIPPSISNATFLVLFYIKNNQFSGSIPKDFGRFMPNLTDIDVSHNFFHGLLPSGLCQGNQLLLMDFGSNQLQGAIPSSFVRCTSFELVFLNNNQFTLIPDGFGSNSSLQLFDASYNQFSGLLPTNLGVNSQLNCLKLNNNKFTGDISRLEFSKLAHNLEILNLANNNFTGQIPTTMATCKFLYEVDLSSNSLIGNVPLEFKNLSRLKTLNLQNNSLTFINPNIFPSWTNVIVTLDLSSNPWNDSIPSEIGSLISLENLNLSYGKLIGNIPPEFGKLTRLQVLDLSHNNLTGELPEVLGELMVSLNFIDISFNNLTGSLPLKWMKFFHKNPKSFIGNPNLCLEYNATSVCINLSSTENLQNKKKLSIVIILIVSLGIFLVLITLATFISQRYMSMKKTTNLQLLNDVFIQNLTKDALPFTFEEIMAITDNLSDAHIIGHGGHGVVYKVASTTGHTPIVVKKIESLDMTTPFIHKSFWREVETLGNIKHRNLVRLLGFIKWNKVGLLLYEYIPNGDLHTMLHKWKGQGIDLPWKIRLCIAEGVAEGLAYLHHDYETPIVHRDIKSSNVLLDNNLEAHISDFGLARVLETQSGSQECLSMPNVSGTYGYIAPEVGYGTLVTPKLDVYSFGILLLELLTGRQPINRSLGETWHIDAWVRASVVENEGRMSNLVLDPLLINTTSLAIIEEMLFVERIALLCTTFNPHDRPTMRDVVGLLKSLSQKTIVKNMEEENIEVV